MKVGFVAILGRPNVGKSTLLNALLSKKVSIVSRRAQTTRDAIIGVLNEKDRQIVFVDTPGIYYGDQKLDSHMRKAAFSSSRDVNVLLYLIDCSAPSIEADIRIVKSISTEAPIVFVLNKIDLINLARCQELKEQLLKEFPEAKIQEASFLENYGLKEVKAIIEPYLEEGMPFYSEDTITDKDRSYQAKEVIREKLLHFLKQEVPHQAAVRINSLRLHQGAYELKATIILEKENHKGIVIGKGGEMIKKISMASRNELERMWHTRFSSLRLEVDVDPNWRNDPRKLIELGYGEE